MLTKKQLGLLKFIEERIRKNGISPSFEEMKDALNLKSKSGIHRLILALEERGFIRRLPHRARALEVIKILKANVSNKNESVKQIFSTNNQESVKYGGLIGQVPLLGKIAAGAPIEAISDASQRISVPPSMMTSGQHFALEVKGESMIEIGINDGDMVIIKEQSEANNGDIVVALINNEEATLKRLFKKGNFIELKAANKNFRSQIYDCNNVVIQGRLVGLLRSY